MRGCSMALPPGGPEPPAALPARRRLLCASWTRLRFTRHGQETQGASAAHIHRAYAPTCVLSHQLSSERRIVLLLQPLHERQALSIRVRGCGEPARRRRTSCAHAAGRRRRSCAPCWQWTKLLACEESDAPRIAVARNHGQSERQPGVITIERSSENQQRPYSTTALHITICQSRRRPPRMRQHH